MTSIGIDIGTTTISAVIIDNDSGKVLQSITVSNKTDFSVNGESNLQDPEQIFEKVKKIIDEFLGNYSVKCIGIAGQMHGVVYVSETGKCVSPLYTWRHTGGNEKYEDTTYAGYLSSLTNYSLSSGYGFVTMFYHKDKGVLPEGITFCSISDYIAIRLTDRRTPVMHPSNAHSFGLFDQDKLDFDKEAIKRTGIGIEIPAVENRSIVIGTYKDIPVSLALGDNQASFLGSVKDMENTVLFNMGTGSQISYMTKSKEPDFNMELRPLINDLYLQVGCSLCGGSALNVLENFFSRIINDTGISAVDEYSYINTLIDRVLSNDEELTLKVSTLFKGTRADPTLRGSITNIMFDNFTPENLLKGFVNGMVYELYDLYKGTGRRFIKLVGAGNGFVKNTLMQKVVGEMFEIRPAIPVNPEQTAYGAALFAMYSVGIYSSIEDCQRLIEYR